MDEILMKIEEHFEKMQAVYFATAENNQPYLRPITLIKRDNTFFIATSVNDAKMKQLRSNKKFEYCFPVKKEQNMGYIRGLGNAEIVTDINIKEEIFNYVPYIKEFWKSSTDENYALVKLIIKQYEYMEPGKFLAEKIRL